MIENPSKRDDIQGFFSFLKCCLYVAADSICKTRRFLALFALYARSTIPKFPQSYGFAPKCFDRISYIASRLRLTHWKTCLSFLVAAVVQTRQATSNALMYSPYPLTEEILLLVGILLHEIGHALVMLCLDVPFDPIIFVPTVGAFVRRTSKPKNIYDEALIAAGGPLMGYVVAAWFGFFGLAFTNDGYPWKITLLCARVSTLTWKTNAFNLVPFGIYDGARIVNVISPPALSLLFVTYILATSRVKLDVLSCYHLLMGMRELFFRFWGRRGEEEADMDMDMNDDDGHTNETYHHLPLSTRLTLAFFYIILFLGEPFTAAFVFRSNTFVCGVVATFLAAYLLTYVNVMYKAFSSSRITLSFFCVILCLGKSILDTLVLQSNSSGCVAFASVLAALLWTLAGLLFWRHVVNIAKFRSLDVVQVTTTKAEMEGSSESVTNEAGVIEHSEPIFKDAD